MDTMVTMVNNIIIDFPVTLFSTLRMFLRLPLLQRVPWLVTLSMIFWLPCLPYGYLLPPRLPMFKRPEVFHSSDISWLVLSTKAHQKRCQIQIRKKLPEAMLQPVVLLRGDYHERISHSFQPVRTLILALFSSPFSFPCLGK